MATETHSDAAASAPGMPQLDFSTFDNQIVWLILTLAAIYFVLSRVALPRIANVLAERSGTITNDIAAAEDLKQKAVEAEAAYNQALADARVEAGRIVAEAKAEIQKDLDKAIAQADAEIAARAAESDKAIAAIRDNAATDAETVAKDIAKDIVAAVSSAKIGDDAIMAAVTAKMKG